MSKCVKIVEKIKGEVTIVKRVFSSSRINTPPREEKLHLSLSFHLKRHVKLLTLLFEEYLVQTNQVMSLKFAHFISILDPAI